jgi:predicted GH43/DUF377 family glycosyl hydrolase
MGKKTIKLSRIDLWVAGSRKNIQHGEILFLNENSQIGNPDGLRIENCCVPTKKQKHTILVWG